MCVVSRIHQFIAIGDTLRTHRGQWNGHLRIMHGGRRQHGADGNLSVGHIPMQFVATPVMIVSVAVLLAPQIALPRQIGQHLWQLHLPLPRQPRVVLGHIRPFAPLVALVWTTGSPFLTWRARGCLLRLFLRRLGRCFRKAFAGFDGCGIACNVTDQPIFLGFTNQSLMHELRQLHAGELVESPGEGGFMRHLPGLIPTADAAQLRVAGKSDEYCLVRANPYTALATNALAMARRSLEGRPIQPRLEGTKRANGIISKVATRRLAGGVNSPSSSSRTGKSPACST